MFDGPESGGKAMTALILFGVTVFPVLLSSLLGGFLADDYGEFFSNAIGPWYFFDPLITFVLSLWTVIIKGNE